MAHNNARHIVTDFKQPSPTVGVYMGLFKQAKTKFIRAYLFNALYKNDFNVLRVSELLDVPRGTIFNYCGKSKQQIKENYELNQSK